MVKIGIIDADSIVYTLCYRVNDLGITFNDVIPMIDEYCSNIERDMECSHYYYILEGEGNFRYNYDNNYKSGRNEKPLHFQATKDYIVNNKSSILALNMETDDYCHIFVTLCKTLGLDYVIGHVDKDLLQIEGAIYNYKKKEWKIIDKYAGLYNLCIQLLMGDGTDTKIAGLKGIGKAKATKLLLDVEYDNLIPTTIKKYCSHYDNPRTGIEKFYLSYSLLNLKEYDDSVTQTLKSMLIRDDIIR